MLVEQVEHRVEPAELEAALLRLQPGPREHAHGHQVDPGLAHQPDVLSPDVPRPLLRVVVAPVAEPADALRPSSHGARIKPYQPEVNTMAQFALDTTRQARWYMCNVVGLR